MITIEQKLYDKMPSDLKAMFIKLPNPTSDEVLDAFPNAKGQCGDLIGHNHNIKSPNDIFGVMPPRYDAYKRIDESKSAARFFYCAKTSKSERGEGNNHPTVKPITLMRYLCRLITPPKGLVYDPFIGSGATGIAARLEGFDYIGSEVEKDYCEIAEKRIFAYIMQQKLF